MSRLAWVSLALLIIAGSRSAAGQEGYGVIYPKEDQQVAAALTAKSRSVFSGPLRDVVAEIADEFRIGIVLDEQAIAQGDRHVDLPVDLDIPNFDPSRRSDLKNVDIKSGLELRMILRLLLEPHAMTYVVDDGVLKVTTNEMAAQYPLLRAYDVRALLERQEAGATFAEGVSRLAGSLDRAAELRDAASATSLRSAHDTIPLEVMALGTTLVVAGSPADHERVEEVLTMMAQARAQR
jgi:hypothetical protein